MPKRSAPPAEQWLGPNSPDPEGRDLLDADYAPAKDRPSIAVANGSRANARGHLEWKWKKI